MTLVNRACQRAVRTGAERIDLELLSKVKNDAASERGREELRQAFAAGRLVSKPKRKAA
jgi:hypothetical protein